MRSFHARNAATNLGLNVPHGLIVWQREGANLGHLGKQVLTLSSGARRDLGINQIGTNSRLL